jgi:hypothetical protein
MTGHDHCSGHLILLNSRQRLGHRLVDESPGDGLVNVASLLADPAELDLVLLLQGLLVSEVQTAWGKEYILATWKSAYSQVSLEKSFFSNCAFATCRPLPAVQHE